MSLRIEAGWPSCRSVVASALQDGWRGTQKIPHAPIEPGFTQVGLAQICGLKVCWNTVHAVTTPDVVASRRKKLQAYYAEEVGAPEVSTSQNGMSQVSSRKGGVPEVGASEIDPLKRRQFKISIP